MDKIAEETISGQGVVVYLMEELTDARLRCEQLKHYVAEAAKMIEASSHKDHFWEVAGHLLHGIPETLFKLDKALSATALAASKLDYEGLKQNIRPEKANELERVLEDARIRYIQRRSGEGTMIRPKQASKELRSMADSIDATGNFPLGPMVRLIAALEGKQAEGPAAKMAQVPVHGLIVSSAYLRSLAAEFEPGPDKHPSRDKLAATLRRLVTGAVSSDMLALLQSANSREEVMDGFKKENPALTDAQLKEIADEWERNKDVVKGKQAGLSLELDDLAASAGAVADMAKRLESNLRAYNTKHCQVLLADLMESLGDIAEGLGWTGAAKALQTAEREFLGNPEGKVLFADKKAAASSEAMTAFYDAYETAKMAYMAARQGNDRRTALAGLTAIANMSNALTKLAPERAGELGRINSMAVRLMSSVASEAGRENVLATDAVGLYDTAMVALELALKAAETEIENANAKAWKAWKAIASYQDASTKKAMANLTPAVLDIVRACSLERSEIDKIRDHVKISMSKEAKFKADEPADPTINMTKEQKAKWEEQNEKYRDKFKSADWKVK